tara:strand:- start:387 stop:536 length:150 start_codon:yes stop_codon:yes gene_type:complete
MKLNKTMSKKEIAKKIKNKFWMVKCNPITGFPPEKIIYKYIPKVKEDDN